MVTNPEAGVTVARPATMPEAAPSTLGCPLQSHSMPAQLKPADAAEKWVAAKALVASCPAVSALPALNPNQPYPQQPGANETHHHVVRRHRLVRIARPPPQHQRADQRGSA